MKYFFQINTFVILVFGFNLIVSACSCADPSQRERFRASNAVYLGEVVEIKDTKESSEELKMYFYSVKFKVEKQWKGKKSEEITVLASYDSPGWCGDLNLRVGVRFLIYARKSAGKLVVHQDCPISRTAEYAKDEIKNLNNIFFRTYSFVFPFPKF